MAIWQNKITETIKHWRQLIVFLRSPDDFLHLHLQPSRIFLREIYTYFIPPLAIRPITVFLRSLILDAPTTAIILAISSFILQAGVWLILGAILPTMVHQFQTQIREREALLITGFASLPLWLSGALFLVPDTAPLSLFFVSRLFVFILALYGAFIAYRAFTVLGVKREACAPILAVFSAAYAVLYFILFVVIGITSHIILFIFTA
ncbi:MAG: hypothetical protein JW841_05685 [Deltaproteobacteria bacterium]|nr:hypothetical protein [Deltaproteobacteria bacterium]